MAHYNRIELDYLKQFSDRDARQEATRPRVNCKKHGRTPICNYCKKCIKCREEEDGHGKTTYNTGMNYYCHYCFWNHVP